MDRYRSFYTWLDWFDSWRIWAVQTIESIVVRIRSVEEDVSRHDADLEQAVEELESEF